MDETLETTPSPILAAPTSEYFCAFLTLIISESHRELEFALYDGCILLWVCIFRYWFELILFLFCMPMASIADSYLEWKRNFQWPDFIRLHSSFFFILLHSSSFFFILHSSFFFILHSSSFDFLLLSYSLFKSFQSLFYSILQSYSYFILIHSSLLLLLHFC